MENLIIEEKKLEEAFNFYDVPTARNHFKYLVLFKMKQEAKSKEVDLKPLYADQAEFYNSSSFKGELYTPICSLLVLLNWYLQINSIQIQLMKLSLPLNLPQTCHRPAKAI